MKHSEFSALRTVFHEPNRLAIVAALAANEIGLGFVELRVDLELTNGNLSRHLKMLEEAGVVDVKKSFRGVKPHTQIGVTREGRERFGTYLQDLENVLKRAHESLSVASDVELSPVQA